MVNDIGIGGNKKTGASVPKISAITAKKSSGGSPLHLNNVPAKLRSCTIDHRIGDLYLGDTLG